MPQVIAWDFNRMFLEHGSGCPAQNLHQKKNLRAEGLCPCYLDGDRAPVDHRPCKSPYNNGHARAHKKYVYKYMYVNSIYNIHRYLSLASALNPVWAYCPTRPFSSLSSLFCDAFLFPSSLPPFSSFPLLLSSLLHGVGPKWLYPKWQHLETYKWSVAAMSIRRASAGV